MLHPRTIQLIMDSLRYWVLEMHVDGFRFDLAPVLARELYEVNRLGTFFDIIQQDPVLSQVKLIAEPWDVGPGRLPGRATSRSAGPSGTASTATACAASGAAIAGQLAGARARGSPARSDLYEASGRSPYASINFVTATTASRCSDLVSYEHKHNEANGEDNRDGDRRQLQPQLGRRGPDATTRRSSRCASG